MIEGCIRGAADTNDLCKTHGGGKRCAFDGCTKSAMGKTSFCIAHGGGTRCTFDGCTKSAKGETSLCIAHGGGTRCTFDGCTKTAQGKTSFCAAHGGGIRCAGCALWSVRADGMLCHTCRTGTERYKQLEIMVKEYLDQHPRLHMYSYYDQTLPCASNRRKPDFVWLIDDRVVILEVDENAHRYYEKSCEIARITELHEQGQGKPLFLVRFNPKKRLLSDMASKVEECLDRRVVNLLTVEFVGYPQKREYDAVEEITQEGRKRAHIE